MQKGACSKPTISVTMPLFLNEIDLLLEDRGSRRFALHDHGADEDIIGPCHVFIREMGHIEIN